MRGHVIAGSRLRTALVGLELFVAVTAIGGGIALATGLEGGRFPVSWLVGTPFADYVTPGLILAAVVGGSSAVAALTLVSESTMAGRAAIVAGLVLLGWIVGEVVLVRADNELVSPMEVLYLVVSLAIVGLATHAGRA